jgi:hypothetical protein
MPPLSEALIRVLAPFAPLFSPRVWVHAQRWLVGAMLSAGARTVTAALRVIGWTTERRITNYHRVLNRATWSARHASQMLRGVLITGLVPPGVTVVLGADATMERHAGRKLAAKGCSRDAVRSTKKHVIHSFGLKWVSVMLLVPAPWAWHVRALPFCTALCWPAEKRPQQKFGYVLGGQQVHRDWLTYSLNAKTLSFCTYLSSRSSHILFMDFQ